jgi:transcriptional regulator with GAF, ATPase, and Fis domain
MTRRVQLKKTGKEIGERIDFLREVTAALLDEVKALAPLKNIKLESDINFEEEVKNFEVYLIARALEKTGGSQAQAARLLKLKHTTLNSKIKRYDIRLKDLYGKSVLNQFE